MDYILLTLAVLNLSISLFRWYRSERALKA